MASVTVFLVIALNVTRETSLSLRPPFSFRACRTCQAIASPSRSGSVARINELALLRAS